MRFPFSTSDKSPMHSSKSDWSREVGLSSGQDIDTFAAIIPSIFRRGLDLVKSAFFDLTVCPGRASLCLPQ